MATAMLLSPQADWLKIPMVPLVQFLSQKTFMLYEEIAFVSLAWLLMHARCDRSHMFVIYVSLILPIVELLQLCTEHTPPQVILLDHSFLFLPCLCFLVGSDLIFGLSC